MSDSNRQRWRSVWLGSAIFLVSAVLGAAPAQTQDAPVQTPASMGGGEYVVGPGDALSAAAVAAIQAEIMGNQQRLYLQGRLTLPRAAATVALTWPLRPAPDFDDFGYYAVTNFVDHDPAFPNRLRDYNNGERSYDTGDGYNHAGVDYVLYPFPWLKMANNTVAVVAAADGVIVGKSDGHSDQSCTFSSSPWNAVYVQHADGTVAWYGHLQTNSLTDKIAGDPVVAGEYLGRVGSSGSSTTPHLHLELRSQGSQTVDPYFGPGNPTVTESLWVNQPPYYDPALLHLGAGWAAPIFPACPQVEQPNEQQLFDRGDQVYLSAYYRDQRQGEVSDYRVLRPDGSEHAAWSHAPPAPHYALSYWWWTITLPQDAPAGEWRFEVTYAGKTYAESFYAVTISTATATPTSTPTATDTATATPIATPTVAPGVVPRAFLPQVVQPDGSAPAGTATPTATATDAVTPTLTPTLTPTPPQSAFTNPGFEQGPAVGWVESSTGSYALVVNSEFPAGVAPHSGEWAAWLGGADDEIGAIEQTVTVPEDATQLRYWAWILSTDACDNDFAAVTVDGAPIGAPSTLCQATNSEGWTEQTVDLGAFAGQTIALRVQVATDSTEVSSLFVDDFAFVSAPGVIRAP